MIEETEPPEGWDDPPYSAEESDFGIDHDRVREVVREWRSSGATYRWIAWAAYHRWPHLRPSIMPLSQRTGERFCTIAEVD
jgi:hypothetical protein